MNPGDPDGHGSYAQLTVSDDGQLALCHECGTWKKTVGTHAWYAHGLTAPEYRARHGLSTGQSLAAPATRATMAARPQVQPGAPGWQALAEHRDPDRARRFMTSEGQTRPQRGATRAATGRRSRRGRSLTAAEIEKLGAETTIDGWARIAQALVDDGVRQAEVSRATGVPIPTVSQRLRRRR